MTAPAPVARHSSQGATAAFPSQAAEPVGPGDRRGRRIYVLWAIALALLLTLGAFCWAVVVPVWRAHRIRQLTASVVEERAGNKIFEQQALDQLGSQDEAISRLEEYVRETSSRHRHVAAALLGACGKSAEPVLLVLLGDIDANVRCSALNGLARLEPAPGSAKAISLLLTDADPRVRGNAAATLARVTPASAVPVQPLMAALADVDPTVRSNAASALGRCGPRAQSAVPALLKLAAETNWQVAGLGMWALGEIAPADPRVVAAMSAAMVSTDQRVRITAARVLGRAGQAAGPALSALEEATREENATVRQAAADALQKIKAAQEKDQDQK